MAQGAVAAVEESKVITQQCAAVSNYMHTCTDYQSKGLIVRELSK